MAKLQDKPINQADLTSFVESKADFAFEMRVLHALEDLKFACEHGGAYTDPLQDKVRQFDIRGRWNWGYQHLFLAAECKNVGRNNPILVHSVPRKDSEAFHEVLDYPEGSAQPQSVTVPHRATVYRAGTPVGKRIDQVGRPESKRDEFVGGDKDVFERITQSLASASDLVEEAVHGTNRPAVHAVVPVLVIPDGTLWQVDYSGSGEVVQFPRQVTNCAVFLDWEWKGPSRYGGFLTYRFSHLEIATIGSLDAAMDTWIGNTEKRLGGLFQAWGP